MNLVGPRGGSDLANALTAPIRRLVRGDLERHAEPDLYEHEADREALSEMVDCIVNADKAGLVTLMIKGIQLESDGDDIAPAFGRVVDGRARLARFLVALRAIFGGDLGPTFG